MARLGRQVNHFEQVDAQSLRAEFSDDYLHRYVLTMDYLTGLISNQGSRVVTVMLKNPSSADEKRSDATIRKVETYVWKHFHDIKRLHILNIFAFRATDALELNRWMLEKGYEAGVGSGNDPGFKRILAGTSDLICAWGGASGIHPTFYDRRILEVKALIRSVPSLTCWQVCGKNPTREPLHGLMWGYDYELKSFSP